MSYRSTTGFEENNVAMKTTSTQRIVASAAVGACVVFAAFSYGVIPTTNFFVNTAATRGQSMNPTSAVSFSAGHSLAIRQQAALMAPQPTISSIPQTYQTNAAGLTLSASGIMLFGAATVHRLFSPVRNGHDEEFAMATVTGESSSGSQSPKSSLAKLWKFLTSIDYSLFLCLTFWYVGNYYYNITNKFALKATGGVAGAPLTVASLQLLVGVLYGLFLWVAPDARKFPAISLNDVKNMVPLSVAFAGAHFSTVFSMSAGAVSFGQIVKASEPAFAALLGVTLYSQKVSTAKWLSLIPVIGGVCLASVAELDFSVAALVAGILANLFAAVKGNENKKAMDTPGLKDRLGNVGNQFAVTMSLAWLLSLPFVLLAEWKQLPALIQAWTTNPVVSFNTISAGLWFYLYNELATIVVKKTGAVTQSVANTAKRVIVIVACGLVLGESLDTLKLVGCAIGILGVFLYSIIDDLVKGKPKPAA
eukprot:EG_transcript_3076